MDNSKNRRRDRRQQRDQRSGHAGGGLVRYESRGRLGRRGSVMILVIAVLVLLALIGTAFITTSRTDSTASAKVESKTHLDVVAQGALASIKGSLQRAMTVTQFADSSATSGSYTSFSAAPVSPGLFGLPVLASRAPSAFASPNLTGGATVYATFPYWPAISAPLGVVAHPAGTSYPLAYPYPPAAYGASTPSMYSAPPNGTYLDQSSQGPTALDRTSPSQAFRPAGWGAVDVSVTANSPTINPNLASFYSPIYNVDLNGTSNLVTYPNNQTASPKIMTGSADGSWGKFDTARRDLHPGTVLFNGAHYPAFWTEAGGNNQNNTWVIAADADGDGVADSGLNLIGTVPGPEFAGITFYVAYRVVDNNSAVNANTATIGTHDFDFSTNGLNWNPASAIRNNRLYPSSVDLRMSLTPIDASDYPGYQATASTAEAGTGTSGFMQSFMPYRAGVSKSASGTTTPYSLADVDSTSTPAKYLPVRDAMLNTGKTPYSMDPVYPPYTLSSNTPTAPDRRSDYSVGTQMEAEWLGHGSRVGFPGLHGGNSAGAAFAYTSFTLADQVNLAYGAVLVAPTPGTLEQLLPYSLQVRPANANSARVPQLRSAPYGYSEIGYRDDRLIGNMAAANQTSWFTQNYAYDFAGVAAGGNPKSPIVNLRPFLVAENPVSQAVGFRPLPAYVTQPAPTAPAAATTVVYDFLQPYVHYWDQNTKYAPGELVYYAQSGARPGYYYVSNTVPVSGTANTPPTSPSWKVFGNPVVPQKVNVNAAPFGDLWRAYYLVMASDNVRRAGAGVTDIAGTTASDLAPNTVTPFGLHTALASTLAELYRGMAFDLQSGDGTIGGATVPGKQSISTPSSIATGSENTYNPQRSFRSNVKDYATTTSTSTSISADNMVILRAAQAAVNAEYLRSCNVSSPAASTSGSTPADAVRDDIVRRNIKLYPRLAGRTSKQETVAQVYSAGRFPYITEVYCNSDPNYNVTGELAGANKTNPALWNKQNPAGYIAVELYNPYPFAISLKNFRLQAIQRNSVNNPTADPTTATGISGRNLETLYDFGSASVASIPANGFVVLDNLSSHTPAGGTQGSTLNKSSPATALPIGAKAATGGTVTYYYVAGLEQLLSPNPGVLAQRSVQYELVLSRPMIANIDVNNATPTLTCLAETDPDQRVKNAIHQAGDPANPTGRETSEYYVPFDSFDFTNVHPQDPGINSADSHKDIYFDGVKMFTVTAYSYHYARESSNWRWVYPGRYDGTVPSGSQDDWENGVANPSSGTTTYNSPKYRQQGLQAYRYRSVNIADVSATNPINTPDNDDNYQPDGTATANKSPIVSLGGRPTPYKTEDHATYDGARPLEIANWGFGGLNARVQANTTRLNYAPFGGFSRLGDLLQVTFVSPVKLRAPFPQTGAATAPQYVDVISLTSDASFAEDSDTFDDKEENVGRFTPIMTPKPLVISATAAYTKNYPAPAAIDDFAVAPTVAYGDATAVNTGYLDQKLNRYGWANRLFDELSVGAGAGAHQPDVSGAVVTSAVAPETYSSASYPLGTDTTNYSGRPLGVPLKASTFPNPVASSQSDAGVQGLINVNTAPLQVLAAVPWVRSTAGTPQQRAADERSMNLRIAQAIIAYREPHNDTTTQIQPLPFRPFRSLFELNRVIMTSMSAGSESIAYSGTASFRTGGLNAAGNAANWAAASEPAFSANTVTGGISAFTDNTFLTADNGCFMPSADTSGTVAAGLFRTAPDPILTAAVATPAAGAADGVEPSGPGNIAVNNRLPIGDFQSQYLMMTAVSNLITTRSDTFTAYIDVEGWANVGTANAKRVIQQRYAYILDRNGAVLSSPTDTSSNPTGASTPLFLYPDPTSSAVIAPGPVRSTVVPAVNPN